MSFAYYKTVTIDHAQCGSSNSTNFPVLISVTDADLKVVGSGGYVQNSNGYDIGFYADASLTVKLDWEVEKYTGSSGLLVAWVKVPTVSSSSDTVLYIAFGDAGITTDQSNPSGTWSNSYNAVWHLGDGASFDGTDSTATALNLADHSTTQGSAQIRGGVGFSGSGYAQQNSTSALQKDHTDSFSVEMWFNYGSAAQAIISNLDTASNFKGWEIALASPGPVFDFFLINSYSGNALDVRSTTGPTASTWQHLVVTYDGSQAPSGVKFYLNGTLLTNSTVVNTLSSATTNSIATFLGRRNDGSSQGNSAVDEVRIASAVRSADWVTSSYNSQKTSSTFLSYGARTPVPVINPDTWHPEIQKPRFTTKQLQHLYPNFFSSTDPTTKKIRGSGLQLYNASSVTIPWPANTVAGDLAIIAVESAWTITTPSGWSVGFSANGGANVSFCVFYKTLDSTDISTGHIIVSFSGSFFGVAEIVTLVGANFTATFDGAQGSGSATTVSITTAASSYVPGNLALYFGSARVQSDQSVNRGFSLGVADPTLHTATGTANSGCAYYEVLQTSGSVTAVFRNSTGTGYGDAIVILSDITVNSDSWHPEISRPNFDLKRAQYLSQHHGSNLDPIAPPPPTGLSPWAREDFNPNLLFPKTWTFPTSVQPISTTYKEAVLLDKWYPGPLVLRPVPRARAQDALAPVIFVPVVPVDLILLLETAPSARRRLRETFQMIDVAISAGAPKPTKPDPPQPTPVATDYVHTLTSGFIPVPQTTPRIFRRKN